MAEKRSFAMVGLALVVIGGLAVAPARADKVGGNPTTCAGAAVTGTSAALFDTDGIPGPSPGDEMAFIDAIPFKAEDGTTRAYASGIVQHPNSVCFQPATISFAESGPLNRGLWPGIFDQVFIPTVNGSFTFDQQDGDGNATGGTFTQMSSLGTQNYALSLEPTARVPYSRVNVSGGLTASGGILGWDTSIPPDGLAEYIGISWSGMGGFRPCEFKSTTTRSYIDDSFMMWLPVEPHPTVAGAVTIVADFDCDGVDDGVFPPCPAIIPEYIVPVELSSFTVASAKSFSPGGFAFAALAAVFLLPGIRLMRRWRSGLDI